MSERNLLIVFLRRRSAIERRYCNYQRTVSCSRQIALTNAIAQA